MTESKSAGLRRERTFASPRFSSGRFHNTQPATTDVPAGSKHEGGASLSTIGEFFFGGAARRPPIVLPTESPLAGWRRPVESGLRATWLGHSTVLLEIDGYRVLTDPVWSERISPFPLVGPKRFHAVPATLAELPPLDAVLVSHDHFDHLDYPTVRALAKLQPDAAFFTSLGVGARLEGLGVTPPRITELDWWEAGRVTRPGATSELVFTAAPARHFSGRSLFDRNRTLWSSWSIATAERKVFFSGDTGLTPELGDVRDKLGPFDLVMLEIGAFDEAWADIHLGPKNALTAHAMLGGATLLPVHWGTFDLALHVWDDPAETLVREAGTAHIVTPRLGRVIEPSQIDRVDPWWREIVRSPSLVAAPG